jgi:hypothetical protein
MTKRKRIPEYLRSSKSVYVPGKKSNDVFARTGAAVSAGRVLPGAVDIFSTVAELAPNVEAMFGFATEAEGLAAAVTAGAGLGLGGVVAAAAGAGYLAGAITDAAAAAILAGMDVDSVFSQTNTPIYNIMSAYGGKFAMSARKSSKGLRDKFQKKGAVSIVENFGSVADPDICYIGQSTYNIDAIISSIGLALLRKLFRSGVKCDVHTPYEELPLIAALPPDSGPTGYRIIYITRDGNGTELQYIHDIPNDMSLNTLFTRIENTFRLQDNIRDSMAQENPKNLVRVLLYSVDVTGPLSANAYRLVHKMDLGQEVLEVVMSTHMVIQNRTKSASGGSSEITVVDAQPVKGPVYEFSIGVPKMKGEGPVALQIIGPPGVMLVRGAELPGTDVIAYKEPPVKNTFQNVVKSGYVRLGPGAMKSMQCVSTCKGFFGNVLFKLRYTNEAGAANRAYGKSQLLCLEEELNSGSANNITIYYECQHIAGAQLTTTLSPNMQPGYGSEQISNLPG